MDTEMEYLPMNIKQETEPPTSASDANENSSNNNNQAAPDSVENKVSGYCGIDGKLSNECRI
jgi:hypothetical protein